MDSLAPRECLEVAAGQQAVACSSERRPQAVRSCGLRAPATEPSLVAVGLPWRWLRTAQCGPDPGPQDGPAMGASRSHNRARSPIRHSKLKATTVLSSKENMPWLADSRGPIIIKHSIIAITVAADVLAPSRWWHGSAYGYDKNSDNPRVFKIAEISRRTFVLPENTTLMKWFI